jgi:outer membrane protein
MLFPNSYLSGVVAAGLLGLALSAAPAAAQQPASVAPASAAPLRIAVIDTEKILLSSQGGKKALVELKQLQKQKESELRAKAQELKELQTKITQGRLTLAPDKLADLSKQCEEKQSALRRLQDDSTRELNKKRDTMLAQIDKSIMPVINQAGKDFGYTLIFRKFESGLIFADEAVDITNLIIKRFDAATPERK